MSTNSASITELRSKQHLAAKEFGAGDLQKYFKIHEDKISKIAASKMNPDRLLRIAYNSILSTPQLAECTVESLIGAVVISATLGLEPNTPLGHAYMVPYWNGKKKVKEVQLIPGYKGLIDLARRSGQVVSIAAHEIYENDEFEYALGLNEKLEHVPAWNKERGRIIGAYAVAHLQGGGHVFEVMDRLSIEKIRDKSQGYQAAVKYKFSSPWDEHFGQMCRKTAIRRLSNYLPMSIENQDLSKALALDNTAHAGAEQGLDRVLEGSFEVVDNSEGAAAEDVGAGAVDAGPTGNPEFDQQLAEHGYYQDGNRFFNVHGKIWNPDVHATSSQTNGPVIKQDGGYQKKRGVSDEQLAAVENGQGESQGPSTTATAPTNQGQQQPQQQQGAAYGLD